MNGTIPTNAASGGIVKTLIRRWWLWSLPAIAVAVAAAAYARVRVDTWEAVQTLMLREEAVGNLNRQGRFESTDSRKTAQETLLEIARNPSVVAAALAEVGAPPQVIPAAGPWPSQRDLQRTIEIIKITAPKGKELGQSDVMYLSVRQPSRARAIALANALCDHLASELQLLRNTKAESVIGELEKTVALARNELEIATGQLQTLERQVGSDLGELRTLTEAGTGEGNLRLAMNKIKEELRQARAGALANRQQLELLRAALDDPNRLLAMPTLAFEAQPALRRLKEGLVDAQLRTAQILGKMSEEHPSAQAALAAERKIRQDLREELQVATGGLEGNLRVSESAAGVLESQLTDVKTRLDRLAELRALYANLVAAAKQRSQSFDEAQKALSEARANQNAARSTSLLTRLDQPQADNEPLGPSRVAIIAAGVGGGLAFGLGLVFLLAPLGKLGGRRWSDCFPGRRQSDQARGKRATDRSPAVTVAVARRLQDQPAPESSADLRIGGDRRRGRDRRTNPAGDAPANGAALLDPPPA
jgi:uncharacterized protein involved in exopolysaccharide biosynthesis